MAASLEFGDGLARKARLDMQCVAFLEEAEAARQEARHVERLLNIEATVEQGAIDLHMDLRLAVGAHAAQNRPQLVVPEGQRGNQRMQGSLARLDAVGTFGIE